MFRGYCTTKAAHTKKENTDNTHTHIHTDNQAATEHVRTSRKGNSVHGTFSSLVFEVSTKESCTSITFLSHHFDQGGLLNIPGTESCRISTTLCPESPANMPKTQGHTHRHPAADPLITTCGRDSGRTRGPVHEGFTQLRWRAKQCT